MTKTEELIDEVLKLDAEATNDWKTIAHRRSAAPILAKMLKRAIEQRDGIYKIFLGGFDRLGVGTDSIKEFASLEVANAELDRIVAEGLGDKS